MTGSASTARVRNMEMAARMKKEGIERRHMRCPMCHALVPRESVNHLMRCKGKGR